MDTSAASQEAEAKGAEMRLIDIMGAYSPNESCQMFSALKQLIIQLHDTGYSQANIALLLMKQHHLLEPDWKYDVLQDALMFIWGGSGNDTFPKYLENDLAFMDSLDDLEEIMSCIKK